MTEYCNYPQISTSGRMSSSIPYIQQTTAPYYDYNSMEYHQTEAQAYHSPLIPAPGTAYTDYDAHGRSSWLHQPEIHRPTPRHVPHQPPSAPVSGHDNYDMQSAPLSDYFAPTVPQTPALRHGLYPIHGQVRADTESPLTSTPYSSIAMPPIQPSTYTELSPHLATMAEKASYIDTLSSTPGWIPDSIVAQSRGGVSKGSASDRVPNLACYFCRSRKIACGRPADGSACNQCTKRGYQCEYPAGSRRGQHKRGATKKAVMTTGPMPYSAMNFGV